jgi:hypothetical protein
VKILDFGLAKTTIVPDEDLTRPATTTGRATPFELPFYDWTAGAFLLTTGVLGQRSWSLSRRQYQAVAWGFMLSLLFGALLSQLQEWLTPPHDVAWGISEGAFLSITVTLVVIALFGLVSTLRASDSSDSPA